MEKAKRHYESTFIVSASLEDPQIDAVIAKVQELITKNGGEINAVNKWGRKRLAYPIQKKNNGFYTNIEFAGPGNIVEKLERHYHLEENIIRYLTVQLDKKALKARQAVAPLQPYSKELKPEVSSAIADKEKRLDNEEKKLEAEIT